LFWVVHVSLRRSLRRTIGERSANDRRTIDGRTFDAWNGRPCQADIKSAVAKVGTPAMQKLQAEVPNFRHQLSKFNASPKARPAPRENDPTILLALAFVCLQTLCEPTCFGGTA
jgi:hypothetical protein